MAHLDVRSAVGWWDNWQLRILVLGSLGIRWFLLVAGPMRRYSVWRCFRLCIWLAYISSDALTIYALATLFNRHARATTSGCDGIASDKARILEVLWAPVLLVHLGGQEEELTAWTIKENNLWIRHTVTIMSQVAVALYAFYESWHNPRDWKLSASEILLFIIGVVSCSEKPWALKKATISSRLASVSLKPQKRTSTRLAFFSDWYNCCNKSSKKHEAKPEEDNVGLSEVDKINILLSGMSLPAAADDLVQRGRARHARDVLRPLSPRADEELKRWLRGAFGPIYTRANWVFIHVLVVPILHIAALTLFATSDKDGYNRTDVKITYILLCLTAAIDVFAAFIRQLLYQAMSLSGIPALWETVPGYNIMEEVLRQRQKAIGWLFKSATTLGCKEEYFVYCNCKAGGRDDYTLYKNVSEMVLADLVDAQGRDLANYRAFTVSYASSGTAELPVDHVEAEAGVVEEIMLQQQQQSSSSPGGAGAAANWALREEQQKVCGPKIRSTLRGSFDRSVLVWHIATDLCFRMEDAAPPAGPANSDPLHSLRIKCTEAISSYMARLLNFHPDMLLTGSRQHLVSEAMDEFHSILGRTMVGNSRKMLSKDDLNKIIDEGAQVPIGNKPEAMDEFDSILGRKMLSKDDLIKIIDESPERKSFFHIAESCSLAKELLGLEASTRWRVMYRVSLGMLFYSASMCRGDLHAKSLDEGGEFLSFVWLVLSLKGAKTLIDKLQMPEGYNE